MKNLVLAVPLTLASFNVLAICEDTSFNGTSCAADVKMLSSQIGNITTTTTAVGGNSQLIGIVAGGRSPRGECPMIEACGSPQLFGTSGTAYRQMDVLPVPGTRSAAVSFVLDRDTLLAAHVRSVTFFRARFVGRKPPFSSQPAPVMDVNLQAIVGDGGDVTLEVWAEPHDTAQPVTLLTSMPMNGDLSLRIGARGQRTSVDSHVLHHLYVIVDDSADGYGNEQVLLRVNDIPAEELAGAENAVASTDILFQMSPDEIQYGSITRTFRAGAGSGLRPLVQLRDTRVRHW